MYDFTIFLFAFGVLVVMFGSFVVYYQSRSEKHEQEESLKKKFHILD